ncbi:MAG: TPR Domain containing protein [Candidatus Magnetoglobus multicellularis str. Araruama]|uniref:TPR Domain containing protein n=1 Tax=Candidatus Magnetoglobus multicellularis str. Araruama TaxID=890399 RepID=A0A1V1P9P9_9BACT|nr:MAG: TPR Domain containing protein [Candidatus Magnetoglobus multicellularis str. Araruama]
MKESQRTLNTEQIDQPSKTVYVTGVLVMCLLSFSIGIFVDNFFKTKQLGDNPVKKVNTNSMRLPSQSNFPIQDQQISESSVRYNFTMAFELGECGLYDKAVTYYKQALALKPNDTLILHNLAINLLHAGRLNEAIARFRKALKYKPEDPKTLRHLGFAFAESGQYDNAITFYNKALELDPNDAQTHKWLGFACIDSGKIETAIIHFEKVIHLVPDDPFAHDSLGFAYFLLDQKTKAMAYCQKAISLAPKNLILKMNFSEIALMTDNWDRAIEMARQALTKKGLSSAHHLAMRIIKMVALVCQGNRQQAHDEAQIFLTIYPTIQSFDDSKWNYSGIKSYIKKQRR